MSDDKIPAPDPHANCAECRSLFAQLGTRDAELRDARTEIHRLRQRANDADQLARYLDEQGAPTRAGPHVLTLHGRVMRLIGDPNVPPTG